MRSLPDDLDRDDLGDLVRGALQAGYGRLEPRAPGWPPRPAGESPAASRRGYGWPPIVNLLPVAVIAILTFVGAEPKGGPPPAETPMVAVAPSSVGPGPAIGRTPMDAYGIGFAPGFDPSEPSSHGARLEPLPHTPPSVSRGRHASPESDISRLFDRSRVLIEAPRNLPQ